MKIQKIPLLSVLFKGMAFKLLNWGWQHWQCKLVYNGWMVFCGLLRWCFVVSIPTLLYVFGHFFTVFSELSQVTMYLNTSWYLYNVLPFLSLSLSSPSLSVFPPLSLSLFVLFSPSLSLSLLFPALSFFVFYLLVQPISPITSFSISLCFV